ncbi:sulfate transporter 4.1, chloroplastic-like [Zingiber officinale]|uniref:sulfate transporter 4.1, chloroplastic-like n=1 Tax=Zingiber officinale TaxID=94328 RepID=UPI001C4CC9B6|nr:sulfate transporter 4.1, chloroplastic-like [Zingiber officinale]
MEGSSASAEVTRVASASSLGSEGGSRAVKVIPLQHPAEPSPLSQSADVYGRWGAKVRGMSAMDWLELLLPCTRWMRKYRIKEYLQADLMAGITVGVMLVPQSMSYAKLAGLHPIYGLYGGFVPVFVYAIFGSSRQLAVGPVALTSLLVSNVLTPIVDPSDKLYTELAILMSLMVGVFESLMGLLRLGWLIRFVNHSVISGFTTASAIVIALSQLKYFLGYPIVLSSKIIPLVKSIIAGAGKFSWPPFVMGSIFLVILLVMKHMGKTNKKFRSVRAAGPLTPVIVGTIFVKIFHPHSISVVGDIPQGLPKFSIPRGFENVMSLIPTALLITGVAILESVGIAKALAVKNGYDLDSNQELFGLGVANICGSFFSSYPSTGSFSRSAVNNESGAQTGLSGIVMGIIMSCALLFMTPLFTEIPQCALAAIVISAVMGLVDYEEAIFLWRVDKKDFSLWSITFIITLFFSIEIGVLVGVGFSLAFVIYESANPHIAVLGRLPGTTVYRNVVQYPEAYTYNGIVVIRIDAPIYFANISYIKDRLREYELNVDGSTKRGSDVGRIYFIILEMSPVTHIDSSAIQTLKDLHQEYKSRGIQIAIANPNQGVHLLLSRSRVIELIGVEWFFVRVHDAVQVCLQHVQNMNPSTPKVSDNTNYTNSDPKRQSSFVESLWKRKPNVATPAEEPLLLHNEVV